MLFFQHIDSIIKVPICEQVWKILNWEAPTPPTLCLWHHRNHVLTVQITCLVTWLSTFTSCEFCLNISRVLLTLYEKWRIVCWRAGLHLINFIILPRRFCSWCTTWNSNTVLLLESRSWMWKVIISLTQ